MPASILVRPAETADLAGLLDLYQHLTEGDERASPQVAESRLHALNALPGSAVLVGYVSGRLISSCTLVVIPNLTRGGRPFGLIENVVTHSAMRGQGYGKAILAAAVDRAWAEDCYKVMLLSGSENAGTMAFYRAAGFEQSKTGFQIRRITKRQG